MTSRHVRKQPSTGEAGTYWVFSSIFKFYNVLKYSVKDNFLRNNESNVLQKGWKKRLSSDVLKNSSHFIGAVSFPFFFFFESLWFVVNALSKIRMLKWLVCVHSLVGSSCFTLETYFSPSCGNFLIKICHLYNFRQMKIMARKECSFFGRKLKQA